MNGKELFQLMQNGETPPRIPFVPSIYEHSASVIGKSPSEVAQDEELIFESQIACYKLYEHDLVSVGLDIYNIEVEALGAKVKFYEKGVPGCNEILIANKEDLGNLKLPNPEKDGRMPLFLKATKRINNKIGDEVLVNGTVMGPFTLAAKIRGFENFIEDIFLNTKFALKILDFAYEVSYIYAKAFVRSGVGLSINESWISPPLLSPSIYKKYIFDYDKKLILDIKNMGLENIALISGGDTTKIAQDLIKTGTSLLMADYNTDQYYYKELCKDNNISLRASIDSKILEKRSIKDIDKASHEVIKKCVDYDKFIFGCGVVSYDTSKEKVLALKDIVNKYSNIYR